MDVSSEEIFTLIITALLAALSLRISNYLGYWKKIIPSSDIVLPCWQHVATLFGGVLIVQWLIYTPLFWLITLLIKNGGLLTPADAKIPVEFTMSATESRWFFLLSMPTAAFTALFILYLQKTSAQLAIWGPKPWNIFFNLLLGAVTWCVAYPCTSFVGVLSQIFTNIFFYQTKIEQVAVTHLKEAEQNSMTFFLASFSVIFFVPLLEEILFRGALQGFLKRYISLNYAIIATALIFSAAHFATSQGIANIELICSLFTLAFFLGYLRERQESLWAPIGLHATFNAIGIVRLAFLE